ncbi:MAG: hypothetical protein GEU26_07575 [Nitrososphaeraceae archaeon]|nr:hypothetical protein [Nitrososphaeraceae archaeon]
MKTRTVFTMMSLIAALTAGIPALFTAASLSAQDENITMEEATNAFVAQDNETMEEATITLLGNMSGNMTAGNMTAGNMTAGNMTV